MEHKKKKQNEDEGLKGVPRVSMDYYHMSKEHEAAACNQRIVMVDEETGEKKLYLNGEISTEPQVRAHIKTEIQSGKKDMQAVIAADKAVSHGEVIHLIDLVKQEGIQKFALNIDSSTTVSTE